MSDIRLVRCPKCTKVLPEPDNASVYQCGACGTLLQSVKSILGGGLSEGSEKLVNFEKGREGEAGVGGLGEGLFDDQEGVFDMGSRSPMGSRFGDGFGSKSPIKELNGYSPRSSIGERFFNDHASVLEDVDSSARPRTASRERGSSDFDFDGDGRSAWSLRSASRSVMRGEIGSRTPVSVRSRNFSRSPMRDLDGERESLARPTNEYFRNSPMREDLYSKFDENFESKSTGQTDVNYHGRRTWRDRLGDGFDQISERSGDDFVQGFDTNREIMHRDLRLNNDNVSGHGKSRGSIDRWVYGYDDEGHNSDNLRGPSSIQDLELERAELLQKYNDLKDQLSGLDNKRHASPPSHYSEDESWRFKQEPLRQFATDKTIQRLSHFNHVHLPVGDMRDQYNYNPPQYDDPFSRKTQHKPQHQLLKHSVAGHIPGRSLDFDQDFLRSYNNGQSLDFDRDSLNSYLEETRYLHPACLEDGISVRSAPNPRVERTFPRPYISRMAQTNPRERSSPLTHRHSRETVVTTMNKRLCYPIAGASPFVLCLKCFQLLKLPWKFMQKNHDRLQCGACATIISFDLQTRSFGIFLSHKKLNSLDSDSEIRKVSMEPVPRHRHEMTATSTNFGSYDFDAESSEISKAHRLSLSSADNLHHLSSSSSQKSGSSKEDCNSYTYTEKPPLINLVRPPPGSTLKDHMLYSNVFRRLEAEGSEINDEVEKDIPQKKTSENAAIATKANFHSHESPSAHERKEDKATNSKDKHSSIAGLMKWGFTSKAGRPSPGKAEVYVNGQPISHRMLKKAEKFSGPIEPGQYWYDSKAGFWGVMGHECLGIIPSSIQELNFPMPANCSGGDTTIYVNGRELHKRDMDLLSSRGLPMTSNERYIIDISGKVVEEETREFVVNLGKLAPSIERKRCGYGMHVPEKLED